MIPFPCLPKPKTFKCLPCLAQWKEPNVLNMGLRVHRQEEIANVLESFISKTEEKAILS